MRILRTKNEKLSDLLGVDYESTFDFIVHSYWEKIGVNFLEFCVENGNKCRELKEKGLSLVPYIASQLQKYPEAPDLLKSLAIELRMDKEHITAYKVYCHLAELYPHPDTIKDRDEARMWLDYRLSTNK